MTDSLSAPDRRRFLLTGMVVMVIGYLVAIWFGREVLELLGVTIPSLNAAGGAVIIALAFPMVLGANERIEHDQDRVIDAAVPESTWRMQAIVPFGVPLLVGGGTLAYLITATAQFTEFSDALAMSIVSAAFVAMMATSLNFAPALAR